MNNSPVDPIFPGDFRNKTILGGGEIMKMSKPDQYIKLNDFEQTDQSFQFIDVHCGDSIANPEIEPPLRIRQYAPPRTAEEVAKMLEEKMQQNLIRRQHFINNIIERSRKESQKVQQIREKMAAKLAKESESIETELEMRKAMAEKARQKFIRERMEKFRKQIEHAETVRNKKQAMTDNQR